MGRCGTEGGAAVGGARAHFQQSSSGGMKYSISICSNSRERKMKLRGVISLRNALPICAIPKGTLTRAVSTTLRKLVKMPCGVRHGEPSATLASSSGGFA